MRKLQKEVLERDNYTCQVCKIHTEAPPHHIKFHSRGGSDTKDNLVTLCMQCHYLVHDEQIKL